jgi:predicted DNA repair protein MutK
MRTLAVLGTAAMFLVGGGILVHGWPALHHLVEGWVQAAPAAGWATELLANGVAGVVAGVLVLAGVTLVQRARGVSGKH